MPKFPIKLKNKHGSKFDYDILSCEKKTVSDTSDSNSICKNCGFEAKIDNQKALDQMYCISCNKKEFVPSKQVMITVYYYKIKVGKEECLLPTHELLSKEALDNTIKKFIFSKGKI